jgi:glutaredoxin
MEPQVPRVTLLGRPGCHLCEDARAVIEQVTAELGESFVEIDITSDPELLDKYWEQIPVTLIDGKQHDFFWVDADRLRRALTG